MTIPLTAEQASQVREMMRPGVAILGQIRWRPFDGNVDRAGELEFEGGPISEACLPSLRAAIQKALEPKAKRPSRQRPPKQPKIK